MIVYATLCNVCEMLAARALAEEQDARIARQLEAEEAGVGNIELKNLCRSL